MGRSGPVQDGACQWDRSRGDALRGAVGPPWSMSRKRPASGGIYSDGRSRANELHEWSFHCFLLVLVDAAGSPREVPRCSQGPQPLFRLYAAWAARCELVRGGPPRDSSWPGPRPGTTPACAGTTHPACRGLAMLGPPPRERGPPAAVTKRGLKHGTTPACAGTTSPGSRHTRPPWDHPRVRGDHQVTADTNGAVQGPPPRARGPHSSQLTRSMPSGTTPACAGTTQAGRNPARTVRDHPRVRGDHASRPPRMSVLRGPPPRARGPHPSRTRTHPDRRTTPACAGTTTVPCHDETSPRDHPRVRGDHRLGTPQDRRSRGPPLHTRGPATSALSWVSVYSGHRTRHGPAAAAVRSEPLRW